MIFLDFETRSRCDLRSRGVYNYAQDPSTEVSCMSYAFDDGCRVSLSPTSAAIKSWRTTPPSSG